VQVLTVPPKSASKLQVGAGWKFGEPDYVVQMPAAYDLPAEGQIDYLSFYIPVPFDHDVFVEKIEMKPSMLQKISPLCLTASL